MVEAEEAAFELLIAHEQFAKAIEPAMRNLHHPPPGALRGIPPLLIGFPSAPFDVGNVAMFFNGAKRQCAGIAGIGTQVLAASPKGLRSMHHDGVKDRCKLADIMSIGSGHDDR